MTMTYPRVAARIVVRGDWDCRGSFMDSVERALSCIYTTRILCVWFVRRDNHGFDHAHLNGLVAQVSYQKDNRSAM